MGELVFFDTEVAVKSGKVKDFGAISISGQKLHTSSKEAFFGFIKNASYICGHNVIAHDLEFLKRLNSNYTYKPVIDTLYLSALLFPNKPYHSLVKDDKLYTDQLNNPLNDSIQARDLFYDEVTAFNKLDDSMKIIYYALLYEKKEFRDFFKYNNVNYFSNRSLSELSKFIKDTFDGRICSEVNLTSMIMNYPIELAYCLSIINSSNHMSITPPWVLKQFPQVDSMIFLLRNNPCLQGCNYCSLELSPLKGLKDFFGYDAYRTFDGESLQENAVQAALDNKSLLAIFPTGGGKSITFQIPALMAGRATRGLTVIISPLQSLMKDQVDNLEELGITDAVAINGLLDPIERTKAIERVKDGSAKLLYISPESLRKRSIEKMLLGRKITRFVIDEAHCFSSWGQDFRVDYLYIGDFIKKLVKDKNIPDMIPVSCFTATAKQNVVADIRKYFKDKLDLDLELYSASSGRKNLRYKVIPCNEEDKYDRLRGFIDEKKCPTIVYASRTKLVNTLAERLAKDGYNAKGYHGQMNKQVKSANQEEFIRGDVDIMVATSAFGMGVDKSNVGLVIHYQISNSLENYVQEAGRAGRDQSIEADCYVLFNDEDLSSHFTLLNQTKLNISEIGQIWTAIKNITKFRKKVSNSALEIARYAGWDDTVHDIETRVTTAISALEQAGYLSRGQDMPRVYADSILSESTMDAAERIRSSARFNDKDTEIAIRIISKLISARSRKGSDEEAESRIDYISDELGIDKNTVIRVVNLLREENILSDAKDLSAYLTEDTSKSKASNIYKWHKELELFLIDYISDENRVINIKEINEAAEDSGLKKVSTDKIITLLNFWAIKHWISKESAKGSKNHFRVTLKMTKDEIKERISKRIEIGDYILKYLYEKLEEDKSSSEVVEFSVLELKIAYEFENQLLLLKSSMEEIENGLFYLSRIGALKIEGGFLVTYNGLSIERLEEDTRIRYKLEDYKNLSHFYEQKVHQIHIVGEYARTMLVDYEAALTFVDDYFQLNYQSFIGKYFKGLKGDEIKRNITPKKFRQLFADLSPRQLSVINDQEGKYIVVAAGPGSGKTRILVHKLAALLLMEDVKQEQLIMLTFSRAAATEFKKRLISLIGMAANYVDIKTFHSFCFDLLGRVGDIEKSGNIVKETAKLIFDGEVETSRITKTVMVIDEAQDMDIHEFNLVRAMIKRNDNMRLIAVGDDDQNIYGFRGSSSEYMKKILGAKESKLYELVENYRSKENLVEFTNHLAKTIENRMKTYPIVPVQRVPGRIELTKYHYDNVMDGLVSTLLSQGLKGSICILTMTNDEALQITGRLMDKGIDAKLIQSHEKIKLANIDEIRYFVRRLAIDEGTYTIGDNEWNQAKYKLNRDYRTSELLPLCNRVIQDFELTAGKFKYVTDFMIFLRESQMEDFYEEEHEVIQVSTMHKSKGREFDTVIIMLNEFKLKSEDSKRLLYVAMTRAKNHLELHYLNTKIDEIYPEIISMDNRAADRPGVYNNHRGGLEGLGNIKVLENKSDYKSSSKLVLQVRYEDSWLSYNYRSDVVAMLNSVRSGDVLGVDEHGCVNDDGKYVLRFSKKFKAELSKYLHKGYKLDKAKASMVVYWKGEDADVETRVLLAQVELVEM